MVRGDPDCPTFCKSCSTDCVCASCRFCHSCNYDRVCNLYYGYKNCNSYKHNCYRSREMKRNEDLFIARLYQFPTLFSTDMVDIIIGIGSNKISRRVPKNALIEHSHYFKAFFNFQEKRNTNPAISETADVGLNTSTNKPSEIDPIHLETEVDRPDAFDMFIQYIYWEDYQPHPPHESTTKPAAKFDFRPHVYTYILAERLQVDGLKDLSLRKATEICAKLAKAVHCAPKNQEGNEDGKRDDLMKIISLIPEMVEVIYTNTPGPINSELNETTVEKEEILPEDNATAEKNTNSDQDGKEEVAKLVNIDKSMESSSDPFRALFAAVSASCLGRLKAVPSFKKCLREIPDFSVDLVTRLSEVGPFGTDENGYMAV